MTRRLRMELPPDVYALFIEARRQLEREVGEPMTDAAFMSMVCRGVLPANTPRAASRRIRSR